MRMLGRALALTLAITAGGAAWAQPVRNLPAGRMGEWTPQRQPRGVTFRSGTTTLTFRKSPGSGEDGTQPALTVAMRGFQPVTLQGADTYPTMAHRVAVGRWSRDGMPFVFFQSFSGGAHCCTSIQIVYPDAGRLRVVDLGQWDGDYAGQVPKDEDGDGRVDFLQVDNRFLYTFSSYAGSFAPPQILNVVGGEVVDVSTKPSFRRLFEATAGEARAGCATTSPDRNGACAGYVAASARLGRFDAAWADMMRHYDRETMGPSACRVPQGEEGCPEGHEVEQVFPVGLRAFLQEHGYIPR